MAVGLGQFSSSSKLSSLHKVFMAEGHSIANLLRDHLINQQRPLYLQPVGKDGSCPWMSERTSGGSLGPDFTQQNHSFPVFNHQGKGIDLAIPWFALSRRAVAVRPPLSEQC
ncbi:hypothetical protein EDD21DRAFT_404088 [Dissophora ornata]|nr:hypothetical protein EDD21DRAFT_404088 [Dissophora ornata]